MLTQYIVDAFTDKLFTGNPAAVCILERWPEDACLLHIAQENNLSETAFAVKQGTGWKLRWMTPGGEIDLCGHATLATAFVLMNHYDTALDQVRFDTMCGTLTVCRDGALYAMDFPAYSLEPVPVTDAMEQVLGVRPAEAWMGRDLVCVLEDEAQVRAAAPDLERAKALEGLLLHITAPGRAYDCVSRSFAPKLGVPEDPVCGSGHCHIIPLWAAKGNKTRLTAWQASRRGGVLYGQVNGTRVSLAGKAVLYAAAQLYVEL